MNIHHPQFGFGIDAYIHHCTNQTTSKLVARGLMICWLAKYASISEKFSLVLTPYGKSVSGFIQGNTKMLYFSFPSLLGVLHDQASKSNETSRSLP